MPIVALILLAAGCYVGWNIGANDAANCIGTSVGANIISYRRAVILVAIFVILGSVLQGHYVMKTIGKGIILSDPDKFALYNYPREKTDPLQAKQKEIKAIEKKMARHESIWQTIASLFGKEMPEEYKVLAAARDRTKKLLKEEAYRHTPEIHKDYFPDGKLDNLAIFVALISAGFFVTLATFSSIPVSTSQSIVGGVFGVGIGIVGFNPHYFKLEVLGKIVGSWIICPILTLILSFIIYFLLSLLIRKLKKTHLLNRPLSVLVIGSACYVAYSLGANDVGNSIGPLLNKYPDQGLLLALMGGTALAIGALTFGRRVTETVGKSITPLDFPGAFAAQISAAFGVHYFSMLGIPVSTSQAIVGAVIGVGLVKGAKAVSQKRIVQIMVGWVLSPTCAAVFAAIVYRLFHTLLS